MKRCFKEYCDSSGIHGLKYFSENRTVFEKIWWLVLFILAMGTCTVLVVQHFLRWQSGNAIVTSFSGKQTHLDDIPFPGLTICSESKIDSREIAKLNIHSLGYLCPNLKKTSNRFLNIRKNISGSCNDIKAVSPNFFPVACQFGNDHSDWFEDCSYFFSSRFTDEGYCHSFNALNKGDYFRDNVKQGSDDNKDSNNMPPNDWDNEINEYKNRSYFTFPYRARPGMEYAFRFIIPTTSGVLWPGCRGHVRGYRLLLHAPFRYPNPSSQYIRLSEDKDIAISVKPSLVTGLETLRNYKPEDRSCYFANERNLRYFKIYSQYNCELECMTNHTLKRDRCINFYMPWINITNVCFKRVENETDTTKDFYLYYEQIAKKTKTTEYMTSFCNCLPLCTDISYDYSVSQLDWEPAKQAPFLNKRNTKSTNRNLVYARITLYFNDRYLIGKERRPMYEQLEFLSEIGGLMGLFMGFSVLSIVEILYFMTIRLICNWRLYGKWMTPKEIQAANRRSFRGR